MNFPHIESERAHLRYISNPNTYPEDKNDSNDPMKSIEENSDAMDSHEEIQETMLRTRIEKFLVQDFYNMYIEMFTSILSVFSSFTYIVITYLDSTPYWFEIVDIAICCLLSVEYLLHIYISQHRLQFFMTPNSLLTLFTVMIVFICINQEESSFSEILLVCSRILRIIKAVRFVPKYFKMGETDVNRQIITIVITTLTIIYISSGLLQAIENLERSDEDVLAFHHTVYFVVVTLSTVGYGDIIPQTEMGKIFVIFLIIITLFLLPKQTNELIHLMGMQSVYARTIFKKHPEVPHVIIMGDVTVPSLRNLCNELFHPDHGSQDKNAVILQKDAPTLDMEMFLHDPRYELFLTYLQGNPLLERTFSRANAKDAKACILLTNKHSSDQIGTDHKNILHGLAIKKYVYHENKTNLPLFMQLIKPESQIHFKSSLNLSSNDQLIIIEETKMNLLAKSCFNPGIICMISNLIASSGDAPDMNEQWLKEYCYGMEHEIYRAELSMKVENQSFKDVAKRVYLKFNAIMFAVELQIDGQIIIRLNPEQYFFRNIRENDIHVYLICEEKKIADQIATIDMSPEEIVIYRNSRNPKSKKQSEMKYFVEFDEEEQEDDIGVSMDSDEVKSFDTTNYNIDPKQKFTNIAAITLEGQRDIINHIIVCGLHPAIFYFILPLRAKYLEDNGPYIIILCKEKPSKEIWSTLSQFPKIKYINGSPLVQEDLYRANINSAEKAIILGRDQTFKRSAHDDVLDSETIFIYKTIKRCNPDVQVIMELVYNSNIKYLYPSNEFDSDYILSPIYASGEVYISSLVDTLTCQAYFNPHIVTILQQILIGGCDTSNPIIRASNDLKQSNLFQIAVPEAYVNKTFKDLFLYLLEQKGKISLGLYRTAGATDNAHPYVYTNPRADCILTHKDKVFILGYGIPNDHDDEENQQSQQEKAIQERRNSRINNSRPLDSHENIDIKKNYNVQKDSAAFKVVSNMETTLNQINEKIKDISEQINQSGDIVKTVKKIFRLQREEYKKILLKQPQVKENMRDMRKPSIQLNPSDIKNPLVDPFKYKLQ